MLHLKRWQLIAGLLRQMDRQSGMLTASESGEALQSQRGDGLIPQVALSGARPGSPAMLSRCHHMRTRFLTSLLLAMTLTRGSLSASCAEQTNKTERFTVHGRLARY